MVILRETLKKSRRYFLSFLAVFSSIVFAQETGLTPEMVVGLKRVTQVEIDPSGQKIAYVVSVPRGKDEEAGKAYSEIWVTGINGGEARLYTAKPASAIAVSWTPDGKKLTFLSKRKEHHPEIQVYILALDGGEARMATNHDTSVTAYQWSPDGQWLAYTAHDPKTAAEKAAKEAKRDWIVYDENYNHLRLWLHNVKTGEKRPLFNEGFSVWEFAWSPDSKTIVFQATETPLIDDSYMFRKMYTVSLEGGSPQLFCKTEGKLAQAAYSPDGSRVAFLGAVSLNDPVAQSLFIAAKDGGTPKNLTENFEGSVRALSWLDNATVLLLSTEGSKNTLRKMDVNSGKMAAILASDPIVESVSVHAASGRFAALVNAPGHPNEVYSGNLKDGKLKRLTNHNPELETVQLGRQEIIEWKAADGWRLEGVLTYPVGYQQGQKYPLALQIHGGPEGVSLNGWTTTATYPVQVLAANGYLVLQPNYRGSSGRGVAFSKADHDDLGGKEFEDVLAGVDALIERGLADSERVGTGGWSYGGYFSAWAATRHSSRFKASMVAAGLTNWISFAGTTDIPHEMSLVHWNSYWYDQRELHWERSPLYHLNNARTPTLIVHGLKDDRVHPEQSLELYTSLRLKNVPTKLVMYPREPHGLLENEHELHFIQTLLAWFNQYLKANNEMKKEKELF
jgi:dipeptidyl aminopeptidase/acylaminoacyl peptidase